MSNEALYQERLNRIQRAIRLEPVDRIPIVYLGPAFSPRYMGMSLAQYCADPDAALDVTLAAMDRLGDVDGINAVVVGRMTIALNLLWLSRVMIPGRELPPDSLWQVAETEVMTSADYDFIIEHGWQAFMNAYMPRVVDPVELGEGINYTMANLARGVQMFRERGYVVIAGFATTIPFENFCGARSMKEFFFDLYRIPDKVQAAMDRAMPEVIAGAVAMAHMAGGLGIWVGGWRAASAMVAPKLWNRFVWPYYVQLIEALIAEDITPVLHWDQDWTRDLGRLRELPAKKIVLNLDGMTDVRKFKELVGDRVCMLGDVPASILATGTPDDVYNYVRDLVRDVGPTGLMLSSGCDIPVNAKPENVEALVAAGREYGRVDALP